jgi:hypothetical protein
MSQCDIMQSQYHINIILTLNEYLILNTLLKCYKSTKPCKGKFVICNANS